MLIPANTLRYTGLRIQCAMSAGERHSRSNAGPAEAAVLDLDDKVLPGGLIRAYGAHPYSHTLYDPGSY